MKLITKRFGEIDIMDNEVFEFSHGIPGFKDSKKFMIVTVDDSPFYYMQSLEDGSLAFIIISPFDFFQDYEFDIAEQTVAELGLESQEQVRIYNIVSVRDVLANATVNLAAPIIINERTKQGIQYILSDNTYSIHQRLFAKAAITGGQ